MPLIICVVLVFLYRYDDRVNIFIDTLQIYVSVQVKSTAIISIVSASLLDLYPYFVRNVKFP